MESEQKQDGYEYMVYVRCSTYNQEKYIGDAMTGFAMQCTNFPYVAVIIDDASTDGNADVIRSFMDQEFDMKDSSTAYVEHHEYGELQFARHKTNPNCYFAAYFLKKNHYQSNTPKVNYIIHWHKISKYLAFCEGDDYWTDRNKLQRQVDFLESHPDYELVFHNAIVRDEIGGNPDRLMKVYQTGDFTIADLFEKWQLPLASIVCRKEVAVSKERRKLFKVWAGGFTFFLGAALRGKTYGFSECWSVYKKNDGGISNTFSPGYCLKLDLGLAYASEDKEAKATMDEIAVRRVYNYMPAYYKKDPKALEMVEVANSFNKEIFQKARKKYFLSLPSRTWGHIKKLFR